MMLLKGILLLALTGSWLVGPLWAGQPEAFEKLFGRKDALVVAGIDGQVLVSENEQTPLIPASTLKILTSLVALHHLGPDYRFPTEFYVDGAMNLKIRGFGDPMLVSEVVSDIAEHLSGRLPGVRDIILDNSYFVQPLVIPGISSSTEPYDAPNGALCVNFNTVNFRRKGDGAVSAEPQTPLLPMVMDRIARSGLARGRIVLSNDEDECTFYAGHLFAYFLRQSGCPVNGAVAIGRVDPQTDRLIYRHISPYRLTDIISRLLEHSNNFTTNQILIAAGAELYGPPGSLRKGVRAAEAYAARELNLNRIHIAEGSGISRQNRLSAVHLSRILQEFYPFRHLMRRDGRILYKTGTLSGISTRAGYIENPGRTDLQFAVLLNTPGKSMSRIMRRVLRRVDSMAATD
jgi:D-alanyl-D-alanine carboxypeptidase/D-alanyl-D-alanine-endopeptidase (penicillin-binding protein 4)